MRKSGVFFINAALLLTFAFIGSKGRKENYVYASADTEKKSVYIGGMSAGFTLKGGGVQIIGLCDVMTSEGAQKPASSAGLRVGDRIIKACGIKIDSIVELNEIVNKKQGGNVELEIERCNDIMSIVVRPVKDKGTNCYKMGILVRDSVSGIGTITYIEKKSGKFGALGHSVMDEHKKELGISNGDVYECNIIGVCKGVRGRAGELRGLFLSDKNFGNAQKLCNCGIFGFVNKEIHLDNTMMTVADSTHAKPGAAYIYSTIDGICPKKYDIEIVKVDRFSHDNKDYVIKITDETLLEVTGGLVQGLSGSPIIQEGKMIGAVTHVFLNDPTRGYAINIETMLKESEELRQT